MEAAFILSFFIMIINGAAVKWQPNYRVAGQDYSGMWADFLLKTMVVDASRKPYKSSLLFFTLMPRLLESFKNCNHVPKAILSMNSVTCCVSLPLGLELLSTLQSTNDLCTMKG